MAEEKAVTVAQPAKVSVAMGDSGLRPQNFEELWKVANAVIESGLAPYAVTNSKNPTAAALVIMQVGMEAGLSPLMSFQALDVIQGSPRWKSKGALAQVRKSGLIESIREGVRGEGDQRVGFCIVKRRGEKDDVERTFSVDEAKAAKLWNKKSDRGGESAWVTFQNRMLMHRARGFALEDVFSDVLLGIDTADKFFGEDEPEERAVNVVAAPTQGPDPLVQQLTEVTDAEFVDDPIGDVTNVCPSCGLPEPCPTHAVAPE